MTGLLRALVLCFVLLGTTSGLAAEFDHGYRSYDQLLQRHVNGDGWVNYTALASDKRLPAFLEAIGALSAEDVGSWSRDQQVAFYINAYNAITLQTIVEALPLASIKDIQPDPWEDARWLVAGRKVSLNFLEHTRLRKHFKEMRVHFVLVCAARGCPRLPNRAAVATRLDEDLNRWTTAFVRDPARNRVDREGGKVYLSRIFDWYGSDFEGLAAGADRLSFEGLGSKEAGVLRYIHRFLLPDQRAVLEAGRVTVMYSEYDWSLNSQ